MTHVLALTIPMEFYREYHTIEVGDQFYDLVSERFLPVLDKTHARILNSSTVSVHTLFVVSLSGSGDFDKIRRLFLDSEPHPILIDMDGTTFDFILGSTV